jgi:hypothetical protein
MSHKKLRQEKNCLNCGATVERHFCPECGQENLHPKESFGHLIGHFITDLTHFDNKFFPSIKKLLFSPGFLPNAYAEGQRKKYMNPLSFYLFVSAIFFWLYYTFFAFNWGYIPPEQLGEIKVQVEMEREADIKLHGVDTSYRSLKETKVKIWWQKGVNRGLQIQGESPYDTQEEYKKAQAKLPNTQRDNLWKTYVTCRKIHIIQGMMKYGSAYVLYVISKFVHLLPKLLFVLLPVFALLLTLFFPNRTYVENIIFLVYQFTFAYICMFFFFGLVNHVDILAFTFFFLPFLYLLIAMYHFYKHDWFLLPKFLFFNIFSLALVFFSLFVVFIYA